MSAKTNAEVVIGGKVYTLSGFESEEYLQKIASYINTKISEVEELDSFKHLTPDMRAILTELNIADDYFKAKAQVEKLELDLEAKEREIYNLKHDLISNQVQTETNTQRIEELEAENKELLLNKTSSSSPIGISRDTGSIFIRIASLTFSTGRSSACAISLMLGSLPSSCTILRDFRMIRFMFSTMCTGILIVLA